MSVIKPDKNIATLKQNRAINTKIFTHKLWHFKKETDDLIHTDKRKAAKIIDIATEYLSCFTDRVSVSENYQFATYLMCWIIVIKPLTLAVNSISINNVTIERQFINEYFALKTAVEIMGGEIDAMDTREILGYIEFFKDMPKPLGGIDLEIIPTKLPERIISCFFDLKTIRNNYYLGSKCHFGV